MLGLRDSAAQYEALSRDYAKKWVEMAADGDHYRLAFDKPGTWKPEVQPGLGQGSRPESVPPEVARKEVAFYKTKQNKYGLSLDNRETYTKLDWILWSATLAERQEDFDALVDPVFRFLNESRAAFHDRLVSD